MYPRARQGGTVMCVFRASARLEPTAATHRTIYMGNAVSSRESIMSSKYGAVLPESPRVPLNDGRCDRVSPLSIVYFQYNNVLALLDISLPIGMQNCQKVWLVKHAT